MFRKLAITAALGVTLTFGGPWALADANHGTDWKPCKFEDGSGQSKCVWDAKHAGNGEGQSLKVHQGGTDNATSTPISHRRAKHLLGANHG